MPTWINGPLNEMDDDALYRLLGDAWSAQLQVKAGEQYYLGGAVEMGKREFATVAPLLRRNLAGQQPHGALGAHACVAAALKQSGTWSMPIPVVTALALRSAAIRPKPNFVLVNDEVVEKYKPADRRIFAAGRRPTASPACGLSRFRSLRPVRRSPPSDGRSGQFEFSRWRMEL